MWYIYCTQLSSHQFFANMRYIALSGVSIVMRYFLIVRSILCSSWQPVLPRFNIDTRIFIVLNEIAYCDLSPKNNTYRRYFFPYLQIPRDRLGLRAQTACQRDTLIFKTYVWKFAFTKFSFKYNRHL